MIYVFDTNSLSNILNHYYPENFPSFWSSLNTLVKENSVVSVSECEGELLDRFDKSRIKVFTSLNKDFFASPNNEELNFVAEIYRVNHFKQNLEKKKLIKGGYFADPFLIARAKLRMGTVVSEEAFKPTAAKIPNICDYFKIECLDLKRFLAANNWSF